MPANKKVHFVVDKLAAFCFPEDGMKAKTGSTKTVRGACAAGKSELTVRVVQPKEHEQFDKMLEAKHYLGKTRGVGDFLRQVIERDGKWVAVLAWGPACLHIKDRDKWIGWNPLQRAERLKLVVQNRRYLLLAERGQEPNLASQALALAVRTLPGHWQKHFGYRPVLAETFTDIELFNGTCYRAAGWEPVGMSAGYSRHRADFYVPNDRPKKLWLKKLCPDPKAVLCGAGLDKEHRAGQTPATSGVLPLNQPQMCSLIQAFLKTPDPRAKNVRFTLPTVLTIIAMALLSGSRDISQFHRFAWRLRQNQRALIRLPFKKGSRKIREIPSYSVYYELLSRLDLDAFAEVQNNWLKERAGELPGALAIDGKMIRDCIGLVTIADHETGVPLASAVISQKDGEGSRCEMVVAQKLLGRSGNLSGKAVTGDALHAQRKTASQIVEHGGEYLLKIKNNQSKVFKHSAAVFAHATPLLP